MSGGSEGVQPLVLMLLTLHSTCEWQQLACKGHGFVPSHVGPIWDVLAFVWRPPWTENGLKWVKHVETDFHKKGSWTPWGALSLQGFRGPCRAP